MRTGEPKVAIVIVNWNKKEQISGLIKTIGQIHGNEHDIFVVDNASTDGSQQHIMDNSPHVNLITNRVNLGGTGGFNTGLRHVLSISEGYEYVWLLDNDAEIGKGTLSNLIDVMNDKHDAGIVGSRIIDSVNRHLTVEAGARIRTDSVGVVPNYRNMTKLPDNSPTPSDYVAICSALVRISALHKTGLMDQRMFIFWDDVDWGLYFREAGFKVYASPASIVYHPSYTERQRGKLNTFYYGVRNSLLVYTKHMNRFKRYLLFYRYFSDLFKLVILDYLNSTKQNLSISREAIRDYCNNNWGMYRRNSEGSDSMETVKYSRCTKKVSGKKILVIASDTYSNVKTAIEKLKNDNIKQHITLLVEKDRCDVFLNLADELIIIDKVRLGRIFYTAGIFINVFASNFDCSVLVNPGISSNTYLLPFAYSTKRSYRFNTEDRTFTLAATDLYHIYNPAVAFLAGEILSLILTPYIFFSGLKYEKNNR